MTTIVELAPSILTATTETTVETSITIQPSIVQNVQSSKSKIGIIYPPPEVRHIVDKTASFVAKNGAEFEARVRANEVGNPKFMFLNPTDPYNGYYQHKLKEFSENKTAEPSPIPSVVQKQVIPQKVQEQVLKAQAPVIPTEPPKDYEFLIDPPSISQFDLDLLKLSAQFVARNGRKFLTGLMNREYRNPQFDFLRPQHNLFPYFTKLIEHYTKILIFPKKIVSELRAEVDDPKKLLAQVFYRVEWARHREREKQRAEEAIEREKLAYARVDWHDFVIVETVDFQPNEVGDFPPPTTASEVGARLLEEERSILVNEENTTAQSEVNAAVQMTIDEEMDMGSGSEDELEPERNLVVPDQPKITFPPQPEEVVIKKFYDPKEKTQVEAPVKPDEPFLISPITGEKIPASKITDHIRFATLDPKWAKTKEKELRERMEQEDVYASGTSVQSELKKFAERRTDIFGEGDQETIIGKKIGEEDTRADDKPIWDGHSATMEKTSKKAMEGITIEDQIQAIHRAQGLIEDDKQSKIGPAVIRVSNQMAVPISHPIPPKPILPPILPPPLFIAPLPPPPVMSVPPPTPIVPAQLPHLTQHVQEQNPVTNPPPVKKTKLESQLLSEDEFLNAYGRDPIQFTIEIPRVYDKAEWKLHGQSLQLSFPPTDMISVIKAKLMDILGLPSSKQKLQLEGTFLKDSNTLAYYNISPNAVLQLILKERGGRKK
ncbi:hypothetical protein GJ496_000106 [Pomphorhynchus laevis]|nr:hypothetical protein GJ496_000106 [Pomphorhynchus laevis]